MGTRTAQKEIWQRQHWDHLAPIKVSGAKHFDDPQFGDLSLKLHRTRCGTGIYPSPAFLKQFSELWFPPRSGLDVQVEGVSSLALGLSIFSDVFRPELFFDYGWKTIQKFWVICFSSFSFGPGIGYSYGALPTVEILFSWMTKKTCRFLGNFGHEEWRNISWIRDLPHFARVGQPKIYRQTSETPQTRGSRKSNQLKVPSAESEKRWWKIRSQMWPDLRRQGRRCGWDDSHARAPREFPLWPKSDRFPGEARWTPNKLKVSNTTVDWYPKKLNVLETRWKQGNKANVIFNATQ